MDEEKGKSERLLGPDDNHYLNRSVNIRSEKNGNCFSHYRKQKDFDALYAYTDCRKPNVIEQLKKKSILRPLSILFSLFPILRWLPEYKWHTDFFHDVVSGMTVAILHIPQGLAYSILAGVPPVVGIYMAFFPVLVYVAMGTSRHVSMGTFAVVCMMAGKSVAMYATVEDITFHSENSNGTFHSGALNHVSYEPMQVAAALSLIVGAWQVLLGLLRLGSVSVILSEHLVSGLVTGAAVLVIISQVKHVFGLKLAKHTGTLKVFYTIKDVVNQFESVNYSAVIVTFSVFFLLMIYSQLLKSRVSKHFPFPLPTELLMIISGTLLSKYMNLPQTYDLTTVGNIPVGFPDPSIPPVSLFPKLLLDGVVIAIVSFSVNISMASIFAEKHQYRIEANQELLASGCANIFGSFFSCAPFSASLSRSLIQEITGGRTQLASIVSCLLLTLVLLFIGPFFEPLPHCVLTGIILAAMKGMILNVKDFAIAWRQCKIDGFIWLITFLSVVFVDIDIGLCVGVVLSLLHITLLGQKVKVVTLGHIPNTDIYVQVNNYKAATHIPGVLILHIVAGMNFANKESVRRSVQKKLAKHKDLQVSHVILDMTSVCYIDPSSVKCLIRIYEELQEQDITINLAKCSPDVLKTLEKCDFFNYFPEMQMFPSIHDAVISTKCLTH